MGRPRMALHNGALTHPYADLMRRPKMGGNGMSLTVGVQAIGVIIALAALIWTALGVHRNWKIARANFHLDLTDLSCE